MKLIILQKFLSILLIQILIALQVNNWNTEKQLDKTGRKLLKTIQKDLLTDIESARVILETYLIKDSLARLVVGNQFVKSDYQNGIYGPEGTYFIYWYDNFVINKQGFLKFKDFVKDLDDTFIGLQDPLDDLYITNGNYIEKFNQRITSTVYQHLDYLAKTQTWYHEWQIGNEINDIEEMCRFFLENNMYKNQVANYINDYKNLNRGTQTFRVKAVELYNKISEVLNETPIDSKLVQMQVDQDEKLNHYLGNYISDSSLNNKALDTISIALEDDYLNRKDADDQVNSLYRHSDTLFFMFKSGEIEVVKFHVHEDPKETSIEIFAKHKRMTYKKVNAND